MFSVHIDTARTWRGGQNQVLLTVRGLRAQGWRTALVAHGGGELRRRMAEDPDLYPLTARSELDLHAAWRLARLLRRLSPDVVHAHDAHAVALAAAGLSLAGSGLRTRFVAARRVDFSLARNAFSRWKYRRVDRFICASDAIRSLLETAGIPPERTTVVYEGVDIERIRAMPALDVRKEFDLPRGAPIVGNVAALVPHKGQRYLIDAAAQVVRRVPDARFLIAGEGELEASLRRQIADLHLQEHVRLAGFRPDIIPLHKGFDLFVMSSTTEGLGTSALDAMACGKAVVATRAGGLAEVVVDGATGRLVPVRDAPALADAIVQLLRDATLRERCGAAGLARALNTFDVGRMVRETHAVYESLASAARGPI
ncbi:MAG: glycosyltransferase [Acidobacteria bacterium]|nr:glycosyltransferase [Acidobacteriota bacterium]